MTSATELELKQKYIQKLPIRMAEIESYFASEDFMSFQAGIHKLAGSAGMYGYAELSSIAAEIENLIVSESTVDMEKLKNRLQQLYVKVDETISDIGQIRR